MTDLRTALLRIIGDEPGPHEDPYERCRQIAADALGYPAPAPMQESNLMAALRLAAINPRASYGNQDSLGQAMQAATAVVRNWNIYGDARMPDQPVELVPHGELMALKERDEARAEIVTLKAELASLRRRVAERDASIVNAVRTGKAFRHV